LLPEIPVPVDRHILCLFFGSSIVRGHMRLVLEEWCRRLLKIETNIDLEGTGCKQYCQKVGLRCTIVHQSQFKCFDLHCCACLIWT